MNEQTQIKLQAYLDAELSASERQEVELLLRENAGARELLTELSNTAAALAGYEAELKLPESREFHWSQIQREIQRQAAAGPRPQPGPWAWLRQMLIPAGGFAALALAVSISSPQAGPVAATFTNTSEAVAFTYQNYETGTTLVWLDFPENDFAEANTEDKIDL